MRKENRKILSPLPSFLILNIELSPGFHLVDTFPDFFSFILVNCKDTDMLRTYHNRLDNIYEDSLNNQDTILVITDPSIKNNVATSVSHIQKSHRIINKSVYHATCNKH